MKLLIGATLSIMLSASTVFADSIKFYIPNKPGGGGFMISDLLAKGLEERGWNVDFKALGNCALVKSQLETEKLPYVTLWENIYMVNKDDKCHFDLPEKNEIIGIKASSPYTICVKADSTITPEDILNGRALTITKTTDLSIKIIDELVNKINPNLKPISVDRTKDALISGEVDVYIGTQGIAMQQNNQAKCYFNSGNEVVHGTVPLNKATKLNMNKHTVYFSIAKNLSDAQKKKLRTDFEDIMKTENWKKLTARWNTPKFTSFDEEYKFLQETLK